MKNNLRKKAVELIKKSSFFISEKKQNEWINHIIPQTEKPDLVALIEVLEKENKQGLKASQKRYRNFQSLFRRIGVAVRQNKEVLQKKNESEVFDEIDEALSRI